MAKKSYMALDDVQDIWTNKQKPWINQQKADKSTTYTKTEVDQKISDVGKRFPVFAYSQTALNTAAKVATVIGNRQFELYEGALVAVCFTNGFSELSSNMTLNVGGTGAKSIQCYFDIGSQGGYSSSKIAEQGVNRVCLFSYTGDTWAMIGYKKGTLAELTAGTDTNGQVWSAKDLKDFFATKTTVDNISDEVAALKQRVPVTVMGNTLVFATDSKVSVSGTTLVIGQ